MRRMLAALAVAALLVMSVGASTASATVGSGWYRLPPPDPWVLDASYCGFDINVSYPISILYERDSTAPDGTQISQIVGVENVTVAANGKSRTMDDSGALTLTVFPGDRYSAHFEGDSFLSAPNLGRLRGFPSNVVFARGPVTFFGVWSTFTPTAVVGHPAITLNVCKALK